MTTDLATDLAPIKQRLAAGESLMPYDMRTLLRTIDDLTDRLDEAEQRVQRAGDLRELWLQRRDRVAGYDRQPRLSRKAPAAIEECAAELGRALA